MSGQSLVAPGSKGGPHFWSSAGSCAGLTSVSPDSVVHLDVRAEFPNGSHHLPDLQSQLVGGSQAQALAGEQRKELSGHTRQGQQEELRSNPTSHCAQHSTAGGSGAGLCPQLQPKGQKEAPPAVVSEEEIPLSEAWCSLFLCPSSVTLSIHTRGDLTWLETAGKAGSAPREGTGSI